MNTKEVKNTTLMGKKKQELVEIIQNQDRKITSLVTEHKAAVEQYNKLDKEYENLQVGINEYASQNAEFRENNAKLHKTLNYAYICCGILAIAFTIALIY